MNRWLMAGLVVIGAGVIGAGCSSSGSLQLPGGRSLGNLIGDKNAQYVDAGSKAGTKLWSASQMNEVDEDELGQAVAIEATNRWRIFNKPELNRYIRMVGLTVANSTSRPDGNWDFVVLDTPEIGAYSGPNGYIFVTRGAIAAMNDEAELAAVLAHEISHVMNRDGFNTVKNGKALEAGGDIASAADQRAAFLTRSIGPLLDKTFKSGWSQGQETAADEGAVKLLIASGYDPMGLPRFLKRLQSSESGRRKAFPTHPGTADRIARTTKQIGSAKAGATNPDRFAKAAAEARL
jgi:predicted Zn-dependent protease